MIAIDPHAVPELAPVSIEIAPQFCPAEPTRVTTIDSTYAQFALPIVTGVVPFRVTTSVSNLKLVSRNVTDTCCAPIPLAESAAEELTRLRCAAVPCGVYTVPRTGLLTVDEFVEQ